MEAAAIMISDPIRVSPDDSLELAVGLMDEHDVRHLPVMESGRLVGLISERDLLDATGWEPHRYFEAAEERPKVVRDYMTATVEVASPDEGIDGACASLADRGIGCLPIMSESDLVGIVTEHDVLNAFASMCRDRGSRGPRGSDEALDPFIELLMSRGIVTVESKSSLAEARDLYRSKNVRHLPVVDDGWFVGMISDRDLRIGAARGQLETRTVGDYMSMRILQVRPSARLSEAAALMAHHKVGAVAVTSAEGRLAGLVTSNDVLHHCRSIEWGGGSG